VQRLTFLKDIGKEKECLIIGGGNSVRDFDFSLCEGMTTIAVNEAGLASTIDTDYLVYNDFEAKRMIRQYTIPSKTKVIAYQGQAPGLADYYYGFHDFHPYNVQDSDNTGLKAVIIASKIMGFEKIYLIGFDLHTKDIDGKETSHFYGDSIGENAKYKTFDNLKGHFNRLKDMIKQFEIIKDMKNIYNCYAESSLKTFPYRLPCKETKNGTY
jgi:hypothetical protein